MPPLGRERLVSSPTSTRAKTRSRIRDAARHLQHRCLPIRDEDVAHTHHIQQHQRLSSPTPSRLLPPPDYTKKNEVGKATSLKDSLVTLAQHELPSCMGDKYTSTVVSCLTCLDESNPDFSDKSDCDNQDGLIIGVRCTEKVSITFSNNQGNHQ